MRKRDANAIKKLTHISIYLLLSLVVLFFLTVAIIKSLFFSHADRINIVFYGQNTALYSLGKTDNVNYFMPVYPDLKILVPGGYGYYRIGALGKLVSLEKKPDLLKRTFSSISSSLVNYYFYSPSDAIYYGSSSRGQVFFPSFSQIWFSSSNTPLLDRLYFWLFFSLTKKADFSTLEVYPIKKGQQAVQLDEEGIAQRYQGFLYHKTYRNENKTIQIIYTNDYTSAATISRILEGVGVRVADISKSDKQPKVCGVYEEGENWSQTSRDLAAFFDCQLNKGKTGVFDIILKLANREPDWSGQ